jgi:UDP-N-acetylmuramoylalanine--D-glutamate ligase
VTGTKGKTTTSSLIFEILKAGGKNPVQVGIGQTSVLDKLKDLKNDSVVVFELSSWRLSAMGRYQISPQVGVITNIYPDHLNYYKNMDEYVRDKKYIFESQKQDDFCVMNMDDEVVAGMEPEVKSQIIKICRSKPETGKGVYILEGGIYLNNGVDEKKIIDCGEVQLRGKHNIHNVLLSIGAAYAAGTSISAMKKGILNFKGVGHRLEFVRELEGVKYFNDSAATMPEAAIFGIDSFSEPLILIAGGSDKNLDMGEFGKVMAQKVKVAVLLRGLATEKILHSAQKYLEKSEFERRFKVVDSMKRAVELARSEADDGDAVLLSPGAASFGLFTNEFDRGDQFKVAVKGLK